MNNEFDDIRPYYDDEKEIIDKVHEQYELLNKIIIENIMNSMTSLDDLPKL